MRTQREYHSRFNRRKQRRPRKTRFGPVPADSDLYGKPSVEAMSHYAHDPRAALLRLGDSTGFWSTEHNGEGFLRPILPADMERCIASFQDAMDAEKATLTCASCGILLVLGPYETFDVSKLDVLMFSEQVQSLLLIVSELLVS